MLTFASCACRKMFFIRSMSRDCIDWSDAAALRPGPASTRVGAGSPPPRPPQAHVDQPLPPLRPAGEILRRLSQRLYGAEECVRLSKRHRLRHLGVDARQADGAKARCEPIDGFVQPRAIGGEILA